MSIELLQTSSARFLRVLSRSAMAYLTCGVVGTVLSHPQDPASSSRLAIAEKSYRRESERFRQNINPGPYLSCIWSRRWMEAQLDTAATEMKRLEIVESHVKRLKSLEAAGTKSGKASERYIGYRLVLDYYVAEAQFLLSKQQDSTPRARSREALMNQVAAARDGYELAVDRLGYLRRVSPQYVSSEAYISNGLDWSEKWIEAAMKLQTDDSGKLAAAEAYLSRTQSLERIANEFSDKQRCKNEVAFYHIDAEFLVTENRTPRIAATVTSLACSRVAAAETLYQERWNQYVNGPGSHEALHAWSDTWRVSVLAVADNKADRVAANKAHLSRMRKLKELLAKKYPGDIASLRDPTECYEREAQSLLDVAERE